MEMIKTRYKGIYKRGSKYIFNTKIKQEDGSYKSVCKTSDNAKELYKYKLRLLAGSNEVESTISLETDLLPSNSLYGVQNKQVKDVVAEYLEDYYSKTKYSSYIAVESIFNNYILPQFKNMYINDVANIDVITQWKNNLQKQVSINRLNKVVGVLKKLFEYSYYLTYISQGQYGMIKLKLQKVKDNSLQETNVGYWTEEEFLKFYNVVPDNTGYKVIFYTLFYTGLRLGELLGLQVKDISDNKELTVNKQYNKSISSSFLSPKSKKGYRTITMTTANYNMIKKFINDYGLAPEDRLFNVGRTSLRTQVDKYCKFANVKKIRIHDFRHSHCSLLFQKYIDNNMTINFLAIAQRLGHSVEETMDTYSHIYPNQTASLIDLLEK